MKPVLVTGGSGQVGQALARLAPEGVELVMPGRVALNLADPASIEAYFSTRDWGAVISSGAYTAVDKAESDVAAAWAANAVGPAALAACSAKAGIPILHLSTDYVFDGGYKGYYAEDHAVAPIAPMPGRPAPNRP
jgi:dTDP-4-dehydrorhamnose reductase